jgi:hypothetical protein
MGGKKNHLVRPETLEIIKKSYLMKPYPVTNKLRLEINI